MNAGYIVHAEAMAAAAIIIKHLGANCMFHECGMYFDCQVIDTAPAYPEVSVYGQAQGDTVRLTNFQDAGNVNCLPSNATQMYVLSMSGTWRTYPI